MVDVRADFGGFLGRKTLIVGEVGSGKTHLLSRFLDYLIERGYGDGVTLIEMAPVHGGVGAPVEKYSGNVWRIRYLRPTKVYAPRLMGRGPQEVLEYAERNRIELEPLLSRFEQEPTEILLINDLTIFLQAGEPERIIEVMELCETFAATAYEGEKLKDDKGSGIAQREKRALSLIKRHVDQVITPTLNL
ncbi:MAG: hypothetical protein NZ918_00855 [Aigarchaeota archaeon]|nr:hypothetical protein [Aigarchaeota archaeon]MDW8022035.1 hypothetical protein [Nitrososphaerota archaeon]